MDLLAAQPQGMAFEALRHLRMKTAPNEQYHSYSDSETPRTIGLELKSVAQVLE